MENDTFPVRFPNIFVDYPLGQMRVGDTTWTNWNKAPIQLWQTQLNSAVSSTSSACGVSSSHLNYKAHPMIRAVYHFHVYYHVRLVLKRFPVKYQDEKFYWSYQHCVHWPSDYIGPDSMTHWILEESVGFTDAGLLKISESVRAYAYLILSSQASARSSITENTESTLTAQSAFLNNFENVVNRRVDIREDIKRYQDTVSYASSKVDYSVGENVYMLPSNINLKIKTGTVGYNNKILVSDGKFILGKNKKGQLSGTCNEKS